MKRLFTLIFFLLGFTALYAQNCNKYVITTKQNDFDSITANYKEVLLKDVGQDATSLPDFFKDLATCWLDRVKGFEAFKRYSIGEEFLANYPETVFLVFNSRSLASQEEKQNWFNLMPMMNNEQMFKLYDILEREMLKINSIELTYAEKKEAIRKKYSVVDGTDEMASNPTDTTLIYLGYYITTDGFDKTQFEVGYWKWNNGSYENEDGEKIAPQQIKLVNPDKMSYIKAKARKEQQYYVDYYENAIYSYLMNLKGGEGAAPSESEAQEYMLEWWNYLLEKYSKEDKVLELQNLAAIPMEELVNDEGKKSQSQTARYYYMFDLAMKGGEYGKAAEFFSVVINNRVGIWSPQRYVSSLYVPILCDEEKAWDANRRTIESAYINWYGRMNEEEVYAIARKVALSTSIMVSDFYLQYGKSAELKHIIQPMNAWLKDMCVKGELQYGDDYENEWYEFLNKCYMDGSFAQEYDYEGLEEKVRSAGFAPNDAPMVEFACYYCLYQMMHNNSQKDGNVSFILRKIQRICSDKTSNAHGYIEQYIAKDLDFRLQRGDSYKEPYVIFFSPSTIDYKTTERNTELSFVVGNGTEALYDAKVRADSVYGNDRFDKQSKLVWKFKKTIQLDPGDNVFLVEYTDAKKNSFCDTLRIVFTPNDYTVRKDIAVLFAVDDYSKANGYGTLSNPIHHAQLLAEKLYNYGFDTVIYRNPDRIQIIKTLREYSMRDYGEFDQLLVFFAGHGKYDQLTDQGYIVPPKGDLDDPDGTMVNYYSIQQTLDNSKCQHVLFISDACHSGSFIRERRGEQPQGNQGSIMKHKSRYFIGSVPAEDESPDKSELIDLLLQVFEHSDKDVIDFYYIQSVLGTSRGMEKVAGPWGDNKINSDFFFNKRK